MTSTTDAPPLGDREAAAQLRKEAVRLRDEASEGQRAAAAQHREAEQAVRDAERRRQQAAAESDGLDRQAARLEQRVRLQDDLDRLDREAVNAERELSGILAEHSRLSTELEALDERLAGLRDKAEQASAAVITTQGAGDAAALADARIRVRAIEEVRAQTIERRSAVLDRLAAVGPAGTVRGYTEGQLRGVNARRDKILAELDPGVASRRGQVRHSMAQLADGDVEAQVRAVAALLQPAGAETSQ